MIFGFRRHEHFVFEVIQQCNHACLHCYNVWKRHGNCPPDQLETAETLSVLEKMLKQTRARLVSLSGGEPLLRKDIHEIIDFIRSRGVFINLITNGSLLDEATIARLVPDKISIFELPLLCVRHDIHDRMSGKTGAFDRATEAMARLKAAGQRVVGVFVATKLNLPYLQETLELALALGIDGVMFNRFNPGGEGIKNLELLQAGPEELSRALEIADRFSEKYHFSISCSIPMPPCLFDTSRYKNLSFGFCAAGTKRGYYTLDTRGNVRPCNHSATILGNIHETGFWKMVQSKTMNDFVKAVPEICKSCQHVEECRGCCKAAGEAVTGSITDPDPFIAAWTKSQVARYP